MATRWRSGQPARLAGVHRSLQGHRCPAPAGALRCLAAVAGRAAGRRSRGSGGGRDGRRPSAADLHLLPSGPAGRWSRGADAARGLRSDHRGDRPGLSGAAQHHRPAHRASQGEDPRCPAALSGAGARGTAGAPGERAAGDLPGVQRRVFGIGRGIADPRRPLRRGHSAGSPALRAAARRGGRRAAGADAAA